MVTPPADDPPSHCQFLQCPTVHTIPTHPPQSILVVCKVPRAGPCREQHGAEDVRHQLNPWIADFEVRNPPSLGWEREIPMVTPTDVNAGHRAA